MSEVTAAPVVQNLNTTPVADKPVADPVVTQGTVLTPVPEAAPVDATKSLDEKVVPTPAAKIVPEKYDIKLPEGSPLDPSAIEKISASAKAAGLSNEEAQLELNRESASAASYRDSLNEKLKQTQAQWVETIKSDLEIGGDKLKTSVEAAHRVLKKYGDESFNKELNDTGLGNHPGLVKLLARIGLQMADDKAVVAGDPPSTTKKLTDVLYDKK